MAHFLEKTYYYRNLILDYLNNTKPGFKRETHFISVISTPSHQDSGFLTLLQTFGFPGLEIQLDGEWFSVQVIFWETSTELE